MKMLCWAEVTRESNNGQEMHDFQHSSLTGSTSANKKSEFPHSSAGNFEYINSADDEGILVYEEEEQDYIEG